MDHLHQDSVDWAITHINRYGDTDIFPVPFEYTAIRHSWLNLRKAIVNIDLSNYEGRPFRRMLVPKQTGGFRIAIQLDPIDTIIYTALAYEAAERIEAYRIPLNQKVACSYRVQIDPKGELFRKTNGWDDFHSKSQELVESGRCQFVVTADIADFFNQIGHHRVRNALELAGVNPDRAKNIENLLMNFTRGQSQGIPIGPSASAIFAEACLSDVDSLLLRKGYAHTRYVDDFRIFCETKKEAFNALHDLTEYLYTSHRLSLQSHKTNIYEKNRFAEDELIDPEEIEEKSKKDKLDILKKIFNQYLDVADDQETVFDDIVRENLVDLFDVCLTSDPMHLGTVKYLLRRATVLRTGVLRETVLENIPLLIPMMREIANYFLATTKKKYVKMICKRIVNECQSNDLHFLPYVHSWLMHILQCMPNRDIEKDIRELSEQYRNSLGIRPYALLARQLQYVDWIREQKETWSNNAPWDRRAIIWAATALSTDEMNYWLKRVMNAGDILDKAIAESVLQTQNRRLQ
jgi:hypothetical protein